MQPPGDPTEWAAMHTLRTADLSTEHVDVDLGSDGVPRRPVVCVDVDATDPETADRAIALLDAAADPRPVLVGLARHRPPAGLGPLLRRMTVTLAPGPAATCAGSTDDLEGIVETVAASPVAAVTFSSLLRRTPALDVETALQAESLAYSTLLAGPEFARWRSVTPARPVSAPVDPVAIERRGGTLTLRLDNAPRRNAFGAATRDALVDALEIARLDPGVTEVIVSGAGPAFCSGGDLDEFGTAGDPAVAPRVRMDRAVGLRVHRLADRVRFRVHGACVGAGIEVPAFAGRVEAEESSWFRLPELAMGLVPGAGGTVSIPRRIGPWRTAWMVLTGLPVDLPTALAWGLVDERA